MVRLYSVHDPRPPLPPITPSHTHPPLSTPSTPSREKWTTSKNMKIHYELVNKSLIDCGIAEANPDFDETDQDSTPIRFIPDQAYRLVSMDETRVVSDMSKDTDRSKGVCVKGEGGHSTDKDEKGTKGGVSFSAAGSNRGDGSSGPPMFVFARKTQPKVAWLKNAPSGTACPPGSATPYPSRFDFNDKGSFDSEKFLRYVEHCVVGTQPGISPARRSILIIDGVNTHLSFATISFARCVHFQIHASVRALVLPHTISLP